jgi:hypothetical protein
MSRGARQAAVGTSARRSRLSFGSSRLPLLSSVIRRKTVLVLRFLARVTRCNVLALNLGQSSTLRLIPIEMIDWHVRASSLSPVGSSVLYGPRSILF